MSIEEKYNELMGLYKDINVLSSIGSVLGYDLEAGIMAPAGIEHRGLQRQMLSKIIYQKQNDKRYVELIEQLQEQDLGDEIKNRNIELLNRGLQTVKAVPSDLVGKLSRQANTTNQAWKKAKKARDWKMVEKETKDLFDLTVERAQIIADVKGFKKPQSALLNERDPGFTVDKLDQIFSETRSFLVPMIKKIQERQGEVDTSVLQNDYPRNIKEKMGEAVCDLFEYDYSTENARGRIGEVTHPLTITCGPDDVRVTVNYTNYASMISAMQHELGHGLHGLSRNPDWMYTPINNYVPPSVAEMTSRYTENKIGKEPAFWDAYYPKLQELSGLTQSKEEFLAAFNYVNPSFRRMDADEVSYGLHIIIRFELEKALFDQKLEFREIPQAWSDKYSEYLGVEILPPDGKTEGRGEGPLQDLHWYSYYWCYFQGYALGDLLGSQVHYTMAEQAPTWREDLSNGNMGTMNRWLEENVYRKRARYDPIDLIEKTTGKKFETKYLKKYLKGKYLG